MRRNFRDGHRGGQNWQSSTRMSGGRPSMVVDLGLQDIDKELELLQRKREIIEQQQQILSNEFRGRNEYEESYRQSSRYDDFASSYNERRDYNPSSRKRPIPVWEDDIPNKRFSGPVRSRTRPFARPAPPPLMRSGPVRPLSGPFRPKPPKRSPPPPKTVRAPPTKQPTERKKASESVSKAPEALPPDDLNRLCPDQEPTKQVRGRLELALGSIIKQIRTEGEANSLKAPAVIRDVKSVVRDRIREIMMGRVVGTSDSIIARYREVYDKQTDAELVANAVQAQSGNVAPIKLEDPEKYFKLNMQRLMHMKLKQLLDQLEKAALAEYGTGNEKKNEIVDTAATETPTKIVPDEVDIEAEKNPLDESITSTEKFRNLEKWMMGRMTSMIKKYLPYFLKLMDIDTKYSQLKNMITSDTVKMLVEKDSQQITDMIESGTKALQNNTLNKPLPYYAKLLGKPGLPRRNQMELFFEPFAPKSIKKHRTVHNLLFVGFNNKEFFEQFLAADGTVIGKHTLSIRVSDRARTESCKPKQDLNSSISSEDKLIGSELDEQITDLLSSIRKAEEDETNVKTEGDDVKTEGDDVNTKGDDVKTEGNDVKTEGNYIKTEKGDVETECDVDITEVDVKTVGNDEKPDGNDVKTDGNDVKTDGNDVKTEENNIKIKVNDDNEGAANNDDNNEESAGNADANMEGNADESFLENDDAKTSADANTVTETTENGSGEIKQDDGTDEIEKADQIKPLLDNKTTGRSTPSRASSRIAATPSRIQTRRASRLAQNDA